MVQVYTHQDFQRVKSSKTQAEWRMYAIQNGMNDTQLFKEIIMDYGQDAPITDVYAGGRNVMTRDGTNRPMIPSATTCDAPKKMKPTSPACFRLKSFNGTSEDPFSNSFTCVKEQQEEWTESSDLPPPYPLLPAIDDEKIPPVVPNEDKATGKSMLKATKAEKSADALKSFMPLFDRVVVERLAAETTTKGGILMPEKAQSKVLEATVVAVGPGYQTEEGKTIPMHVTVGDRVLLPEHEGSKLTIAEKEYHIYRESDIIGKFGDK